jgi:uncharacterized protein
MLLIPIALIVLLGGAVLGLGWQASGRAMHPGPEAYGWSPGDFPDLSGEDVAVESPTGARLAGRFFAGRAPATVVLLHGYGGNQDELLPVADELHDAGYSVFTFDQRGCGRSTGEITFGAREQEDLIAVVDHLVSRPDVDAERLGVFGFSMGGATAIMATARDSRIKALAADSAWAEARAWLRPSVGAVFTHPRDRFTALSLKLVELRTGIDLDDLRPADVIGRISPRPLLLIHGTADEVVAASQAQRNDAAAREPKELVLVEGASHGGTITPGEAFHASRVRAFFDRAFGMGKEAAA